MNINTKEILWTIMAKSRKNQNTKKYQKNSKKDNNESNMDESGYDNKVVSGVDSSYKTEYEKYCEHVLKEENDVTDNGALEIIEKQILKDKEVNNSSVLNSELNISNSATLDESELVSTESIKSNKRLIAIRNRDVVNLINEHEEVTRIKTDKTKIMGQKPFLGLEEDLKNKIKETEIMNEEESRNIGNLLNNQAIKESIIKRSAILNTGCRVNITDFSKEGEIHVVELLKEKNDCGKPLFQAENALSYAKQTQEEKEKKKCTQKFSSFQNADMMQPHEFNNITEVKYVEEVKCPSRVRRVSKFKKLISRISQIFVCGGT
ncbi:hypothetical protein CWI37_0608p0020 [Hamiltosporidium tvaerminnensis]|uniref:Uncharacterized protein n=1 Tax=Hamiltosporidium tvaerminnensis TaxID=1176355 RepID=A0A4Q9L369_9MICR|nr:hypothetical protein CWI37_0608p0020 [Hamiltosporidium tvaerminnensis]